jgi:hypothetical protein
MSSLTTYLTGGKQAQRMAPRTFGAVLVLAGVGDGLGVEDVEDAAPGVEVVVPLEDVLAGVVESAVAEQEAEAAEGEVALVVAFDGVGDEVEADFVVGTSKGATGVVAPNAMVWSTSV